MSQEEPQCHRCGTSMHIGFIADNADAGVLVQGRWVEGLPVTSKFFGLNTGTLNIRDRQTLPLLAYRCPECSVVEFFARSEDREQELLLRPTTGEGASPSEELLRSSEPPDPER